MYVIVYLRVTYLSMYCTVCAYVCIDGWTHACMYAWRYVFMYCMHECMGAFIHACIHACMYCIHVFLYACVLTSALLAFRGICSCGSDLEGSTSLAIKLHEILQLRLARFHSQTGNLEQLQPKMESASCHDPWKPSLCWAEIQSIYSYSWFHEKSCFNPVSYQETLVITSDTLPPVIKIHSSQVWPLERLGAASKSHNFHSLPCGLAHCCHRHPARPLAHSCETRRVSNVWHKDSHMLHDATFENLECLECEGEANHTV